MSSVPSNSVNSPRTVAMPRCLMAKPTRECVVSTVQVPVGAMVAVLIDCLPEGGADCLLAQL